MMLSVFKPTRPTSNSEKSSSSDEERVLPPGTPYLTKVNGKLVWARQKTPKPVNPVQDLLGEAFGTRTTIIRKRSKSLEKPETKLIMGNIPIVHTQQLTYSTPLLQQGFPGSAPAPPLMIQYSPQYPSHPMPQPQPPAQPPRLYIPSQPRQPLPLFVQPSPTEKDFDQLKVLDMHFNKVVNPQPTRLTSVSSEDSQDKPQDKLEKEMPKEKSAVKVAIAVTKHVCAECGRLRSRKYHHDNPLKPGEIPTPAFCRKCQKDTSSTSESSAVGEYKRKEKKKTKKKAKQQKKPVEISSDDESSSGPPAPEPRKKPKADQPKEPTATRVSSEEYIIVEEEFSDHERQPRRRTRSRSTVSEQHKTLRRPLSPLNGQHSRPRSHSRSIIGHEPHPNPIHPVKVREIFKETMRHRSPSIPYRYVEVVPSHASFESLERLYPRKDPIHFVEEVVYEKSASLSKNYGHRESLLGRAPSSKAYSVEEPESMMREHHGRDHSFELLEASTRGPPSNNQSFEVHEPSLQGPPSRAYSFEDRGPSTRVPPSREHSFEERESVGSIQSREARRRRRERAPSGSPVSQPWEVPHVFHPRTNEEVVVVTETFEYRPKKQTHDEEERRRQEYIDRATLSPRKSKEFSAQEAEKYYHDDWSRDWPAERPTPSIIRRPSRGYRRERYPESELTGSEASYQSAPRPPPRVPSPLSPISGLKVDEWQDQPPYPLSSDSQDIRRLQNTRRGNKLPVPPVQTPRSHQRRSSRTPSSHAWEVADERMDTAIILSPRHSMKGDRYAYDEVSGSDLTARQDGHIYDEVSVSNLTDLEREAEAEAEATRHVTFRNTPSLRSIHETWEPSELNSQRSRSEQGGGGWDESGGHGGTAW